MFDAPGRKKDKILEEMIQHDKLKYFGLIFWLGFVVNPVKFLLQYHSLFPLCFS